MADAKIINYGQPIGGGTTTIPDNTSVALDIESTDAKDYITIDTTDGDEKVRLLQNTTVVTNNADDATAKSMIFTRSRSNTDGTAVVVQDDDILGNIEFQGAEDGDSYATGAKIFARVNGTPGDGDMPTELVFQTTRDNTETPETRFSISEKGIGAFTSDSGSASVITVGREGLSDSMEIRVGTGMELNTIGTSSLRISQSYKEVADFNGETLVLENISSTSSSTSSGGLWVNLANTCTSSGTGNRTIASTGHKLKVGDAVSLRSGDSSAYEVFTVASVTDADTFEVDSDLANAITSQIGKTDGIKLQVKTGDGAVRFAVAGDGVITAGTNPGSTDGNLTVGDADALDALTTGNRNYIFGHASDNYKLTSGQRNVFAGFAAGEDVTTGLNNVLIGVYTGSGGSSIQDCTMLGYSAGAAATGNSNVFIGREAGNSNTGNQSVAIGNYALDASGGSGTCVSIGHQSLTGCTGDSNIAIGYQAGDGVSNGGGNLLLGHQADCAHNLNYQIAIGFQVSTAAASTAAIGDATNTATLNFGLTGQSWSTTSDQRIKENITESTLGLDFINALRPVSYTQVNPADWPEDIRPHVYFDREKTRTNENGEEETYIEPAKERGPTSDFVADGLIAQEVKAAADAEGVSFSGWEQQPNGLQRLQYEKFVLPLIKAVQELSSQNESLIARIEQLESGE